MYNSNIVIIRMYVTTQLPCMEQPYTTTHTVGGVIEDNEVFGNKFDGICLATGVNPKLKGEL